jgi:leucyl aminopeptidase
MNTTLRSTNSVSSSDNLIILSYNTNLDRLSTFLNKVEFSILYNSVGSGNKQIFFPQENRWIIIEIVPITDNRHQAQEKVRCTAANTIKLLRQYKLSTATFIDNTGENFAQFYAEGLVLANYQFLKYFSAKDKIKSSFEYLQLLEENISSEQVTILNTVLEGVCAARDLVNEPLSYLTAPQLSEEIKMLGKIAGFSVKVLEKKTIKEMGMGGLIAVNLGSKTPPTFSILEWKPNNAVNKQPIVLVGKGVVYDTGGLSLKATANGMDFMKCDMGGSASVIGATYAVAKNKLPIHLICLVPATDNRPGLDAYVPGDVITMYSGSTVEVLNTDAEGRMILADALHYAKQYNPELVLDFATLTGASARAIGNQAAVFMGTASYATKKALTIAGHDTHERLVEFPLWEEYAEMIKSDIADIKNIGGPGAGSITAGKFLQHFTDYNWIHVDIAGVAYMHHEDAYRVKGGTGYGVQLLYNFLSNYSK